MSETAAAEYHWRETYFILFDEDNRPLLETLRFVINRTAGGYEFVAAEEDDDNLFCSARVIAPDKMTAIELSYVTGAEVLESVSQLVHDLQMIPESCEPETLDKLRPCNARIDVFHLEKEVDAWTDTPGGNEDDFFDPSALLLVIEALVEATDGIGIDPSSGVVMTGETGI